jgi:hypothetical protein
MEERADTEQGNIPSTKEDEDKKYASYKEWKVEKKKRQKALKVEAERAKEAAKESRKESDTQSGSGAGAGAGASQGPKNGCDEEEHPEGQAKDGKLSCVVL